LRHASWDLALMPGISPEALAGYILEEMLAYLLRNAGYRLITDASQDPRELANRHHGLVVRGRGADHQVDVLGELLWIPAFTFPLRLVLEARCRNGKTDIATVRGMVAALLDINQNNMPNRADTSTPRIPRAKYTYVGAIFSASGFSTPAADFALAHAVSLIDLRTGEFKSLVSTAQSSGAELSRWYRRQDRRSAEGFVRAVRDAIRASLEPRTRESAERTAGPAVPENLVAPAVESAAETRELFIGMASGPYMLVLKADDPRRFLQFADRRPTHEVNLRRVGVGNEGETWEVVPKSEGGAYRLVFRLPEALARWIFEAENVRRAAGVAREGDRSSLTIYRNDGRKDQLIRLTYDPRELGA
jgi:hypothetical protein